MASKIVLLTAHRSREEVMIPPRLRVLLVLIPLLGAGWLGLALIDPDGRGRLYEYLGLGYLFGTLFGQTSVAAAWTAFGPLPWYVRLPLAGFWLVLLVVALAINLSLHGGPREVIVLMPMLLFGQWLLMQVPLWSLALTYRLELRHGAAAVFAESANGRARLQFGIRELLTLTVVVAVLLGVLRALLSWAVSQLAQKSGGGDALIFIFLAIAALVMTLPLVMATLLPRWAVPATAAVLLLGALATAFELPLLRLLPKSAGLDQWHFVFLNGITAAWIVALIGAVRLSGFTLAPRRPRTP